MKTSDLASGYCFRCSAQHGLALQRRSPLNVVVQQIEKQLAPAPICEQFGSGGGGGGSPGILHSMGAGADVLRVPLAVLGRHGAVLLGQ